MSDVAVKNPWADVFADMIDKVWPQRGQISKDTPKTFGMEPMTVFDICNEMSEEGAESLEFIAFSVEGHRYEISFKRSIDN